MGQPWAYYGKVAGVCFAVSGCRRHRRNCRQYVQPPSDVTSHWPTLPIVLQLGAGMEYFMIKTGFYEK